MRGHAVGAESSTWSTSRRRRLPPATEPVCAGESCHRLAMQLCSECGLAQLADDDTDAAEPRGIEPQALREQAADAVDRVARAGWLQGSSACEFGSPHGGTWLQLLADRGFMRSEVVLDSFGIMHESDQRSAFERRAQAMTPDGVLLIQFYSLADDDCQPRPVERVAAGTSPTTRSPLCARCTMRSGLAWRHCESPITAT